MYVVLAKTERMNFAKTVCIIPTKICIMNLSRLRNGEMVCKGNGHINRIIA